MNSLFGLVDKNALFVNWSEYPKKGHRHEKWNCVICYYSLCPCGFIKIWMYLDTI
jgi:hypothetical protein